MIVKSGPQGIEGLGFTSTDEVHVVTAAAMVERNRLIIGDGILQRLAPGRLFDFVEQVYHKLPAGKRLAELIKVGQQAILNSELVQPDQEARLDLTRSPDLSKVAVHALGRYIPFMERVAPNNPPDLQVMAQDTLELTRSMVEQINASDPSSLSYAHASWSE